MACITSYKNKVGFLDGGFSQSELFQCFLNYSDWLDKSRPPKGHFYGHANKLNMT